jgi:hypothetical protein
MSTSGVAMIVTCWLGIAVGLWTVILSIRGAFSAPWGAALGVFMIVIGLNGFITVRITKLEETIIELKKKNEKQP